ncbi:MAG: hypothetical protein ACK4RK_09190 [Gemmataceae bacterium]
MEQLGSTLLELLWVLLELARELAALGLQYALLIAWVAWWLCGANWKKIWPVLAQGAWLPLVLLMVAGALVWSQLAPSACTCLGFVTVGNFWWQLGAVGLLAASALLCGWLQGVLQWTPPEIDLEPPAAEHGHH